MIELTRLNGSTARNRRESKRFMLMPERNAYDSQMSEHTRCQKLFRVLNRLMNASKR